MPRLNKTPNKDIKYYIKYKIKKWNISFIILDFQRFAIEFRERRTQTSYLLRPVEDLIQFCKSVSNLYSCMIGWVFSRKMKLCGIEQKGATSQANTSIVLRSCLWSRHPFWVENNFCHFFPAKTFQLSSWCRGSEVGGHQVIWYHRLVWCWLCVPVYRWSLISPFHNITQQFHPHTPCPSSVGSMSERVDDRRESIQGDDDQYKAGDVESKDPGGNEIQWRLWFGPWGKITSAN